MILAGGLDTDIRSVSWLPLYHDMGLIMIMFPVLMMMTFVAMFLMVMPAAAVTLTMCMMSAACRAGRFRHQFFFQRLAMFHRFNQFFP